MKFMFFFLLKIIVYYVEMWFLKDNYLNNNKLKKTIKQYLDKHKKKITDQKRYYSLSSFLIVFYFC
jgi:hypothetical protein